MSFLTPASPGGGGGGDFGANVDALLAPALRPNEAVYAILRRYTAAPRLVAVTYVPDAAPVRQKMLFASTRLALVRELGGEHFRETLTATDAAELTARGFERHDAHARLAAPLTDEERSLGDVKRAEQEAGSGTGSLAIHLSKTMKMPVQEAALAALRELEREEEGGRVLVILVGFFPHSPELGAGWLAG